MPATSALCPSVGIVDEYDQPSLNGTADITDCGTENLSNLRFGSVNMDMDTVGVDLTNRTQIGTPQSSRSITYNQCIPRLLDILGQYNIRATFFVVGLDTIGSDSRQTLKRISENGHELANHTMHHRKQFALLPQDRQCEEIVEAQKRIEDIARAPVVGFRAPGYTITGTTLKVLSDLGYEYDSSLNSSIVYNSIKWLYKTCMLRGESKSYISVQPLWHILAGSQPYYPDLDKPWQNSNRGERRLLEIPINIIPVINYPFVSSILLRFGYNLSRCAYSLIRRRYQFLNFELHDGEFLEPQDLDPIANEQRALGYSIMGHLLRVPYERRKDYFARLFFRVQE